jgi:death-on-curing family protein
MSGVEIFKDKDNQAQIEVRFERDSVWLSLNQMAQLFARDKSVIYRHLSKIFEEKELIRKSVVAKNATTASDGKTYRVEHFNLDVIISVGYRVNSKRGTQFRQWATQRLKDHLVKGYTVNQKRLEQLQQTLQLIENAGKTEELSISEAKGLLTVITNYTQSFVLLNQFDSQNLQTNYLNENITYELEYEEARAAIAELKKQLIQKKEASELFGNQKDDSFEGVLGNVVQSFDGDYVYKSIEEQAAHLLYFVIKSHPFTDGNKRIGAFLFIWFLEKNKHRFKKTGELKINDNALVALALLVAQSNPVDKDTMIKLIINLIRS